MQAALIVISAAMFTREFSKANPSPVLLMIWVFTCGVFGIPGLSQLIAGALPWPLVVDDGNFLLAEVFTLAGTLLLTLFLEAPYKNRSLDAFQRNLNRIRLRNLAILMIPSVLYAVRSSGGIGSFFQSRGAVSAAKAAAGLTKAQSGLFITGTQSLILLVCASAILLRKTDRKDPVVNAAFYFSIVALVVLANPISSSRYWFFAVASTLALVGVKLTPGQIRFGSMAVFIGSLFIFPLADYFRRNDGSFGAVGRNAWLTGDFDTLQITGAGIQWFQANGSVWGHQLLGAIFPVVPRSIWTGKPIDTGIMIAQANGMKFTNISGPWIAESVINFGYLGVLIFPLMVAYLFRKVKFRTEVFPDHFGLMLSAFLVGYLPILLRGSLIQASGAAGLFVIFAWYVTPKNPEKLDKFASPVRVAQPARINKVLKS